MFKKLALLSLFFGIFSLSSASAAPLEKQTLFNIAENAYIYAYPLVLMNVTKNVLTNVAQPNSTGIARAPINQFVHVETLPSVNTSKDVVQPNADTLYSSAWLDLSREPMILSLPNADKRYYLMEMLDAWTEVFASPGKRTTGTEAGLYAIVGPKWRGKLPANVTKIQAPTDIVWITGRIQANGESDYSNVHQFQQNIRIVPLSDIDNREFYQRPAAILDARFDDHTPPKEKITEMDGVTFFKTFAELLKTNPPYKNDKVILAEIKKMGIIPGKNFNANQFTPEQIKILNEATKSAYEKIIAATKNNARIANGWKITTNDIGIYENNYLARAAIAFVGLGTTNMPQDAIYPSLSTNVSGVPLNGKDHYILHFDKRQLPPVNAFWSLTMYNTYGYFISNKLQRYAIGDRDKLQYNADGSLDIYIQHRSPGKNKESNWLPAPRKNFNLILRLYWPKETVITGKWSPPAIQEVIK